MRIYYPYLPQMSTLLIRIFIVRRLLILKSLEHAAGFGMGISYHKFTVKSIEAMLRLKSK